ncbi:MAG: hypothetical protein EBZ59_00980 [Planctomycetia bacterium]|nr:hypothetical protein [Planctomycetia bacterium]
MPGQADIKSIDTLAFVKAAIASFAHETGQSVAEVELDGRRAVDWITVDQAAYWKAEMRRAADLVNKAIKDLEHCRTYKKVGDNTPACIEEKKALTKARERLARAERKAEAVRRWTPVVQQQFRETCVRLVRFREVIDVDCPRSMARLEQMLRALDAYTSAASPRSAAAAGSSAGTQSVVRQAEDDSPDKRAAADPGPVSTDPREDGR